MVVWDRELVPHLEMVRLPEVVDERQRVGENDTLPV